LIAYVERRRRRARARVERGGNVALIVGLAALIVIVLLCIFVPLLDAHPSGALVALPYQGPSWSYPFGTDDVGRDTFVRTFEGGRLDLGIAAIVVSGALTIGTILGVVSATSRSRILSQTIVRIVDGLIAFPFLILVLTLVVVIGASTSFWFLPQGVPAIIIAMIAVDWTVYARLSRAEALTLRQRDFVLAARVLGYPQRRIVFRHVLPGVLRVAAAYAVADVVIIVIVTASLSFLGVGVQAPTPEWGSIMYEGRSVLGTDPWITVAPGIVLALTGLALSLVGDRLIAGRQAGL
jgi:peptide/nickel transport system permease protein